VTDFEEGLEVALAKLLKVPKVDLDQEFAVRKVCMPSLTVAVHRSWDVVRWAWRIQVVHTFGTALEKFARQRLARSDWKMVLRMVEDYMATSFVAFGLFR